MFIPPTQCIRLALKLRREAQHSGHLASNEGIRDSSFFPEVQLGGDTRWKAGIGANVAEPANIHEFNEITGVIFAQLYAAFPDLVDINADAVALALGHSLEDKLESGRTFAAMLS